MTSKTSPENANHSPRGGQDNLLKGGLPNVSTSYPGVMLDRYIDTTYQGKLNYQMDMVSGSKEMSTNQNDGLTLTKM